jgi:RepB DNA-primase from phage plasmid
MGHRAAEVQEPMMNVSYALIEVNFLSKLRQYQPSGFMSLTRRDVIHRFRADDPEYFTPCVFSKHRRLAEYAKATRLLWADLDDKWDQAFEPKPSVLWETSPGHHQALWILNRPYRIDKQQPVNEALSKAIGAGVGGWDASQLLRIPGTINATSRSVIERGLKARVRLLRFDTSLVYRLSDFPKALANTPTRSIPRRGRPRCWAWESIIREGVPQGQRSTALYKVVRDNLRIGWGEDDIVQKIMGGKLGEKARELGEQWLRDDIQRIGAKL